MATGARTYYTDTNINKPVVADLIDMIDWTEAPLLRLLGVNNESRFRLTQTGPKIEWLEDTMAPRSTTINEDLDNSETGVDVATGTSLYFKEGDIIKVDSELMYVSDPGTGNSITTVIRGFGGSTAAAHSNGAALTLATIARLEGADYDTGYTTTVNRPYNYSQILSEAVKVTGTEMNANPKYSINDRMAYEIAKLVGGGDGIGQKGKAGKLAILLEQTFAHGGRALGSATTARAMGGFDTFCTTNATALAGAALTRKHIEDEIQQCFEAGGSPNTIICDAWGKRKITAFYEKYIYTERSETRGGSTITTIETDFGTLEVVYWRWCPSGTMYIIEKEMMGWVTLRPFAVYDRASTGDYTVKDVLGEYSFVCKTEKAHSKLSGYSTTS
jgi:hypothetical protein